MFDLALNQGIGKPKNGNKAKMAIRGHYCFVVRIQLDGEKYLLSTAVDITKLKRSQKALKSISANLQNIIETLEEGIVIAELDGSVLECNNKCLRLIRCTKADFLGKNIYDFFLPKRNNKSLKKR